jgi:CRISPR/Cas system-associated exonuclease Cas4 (RecB family)
LNNISCNKNPIISQSAFEIAVDKHSKIAPFLCDALSGLGIINRLKKIIFIHVSDLVFCPRQASFRRLNEIPENQNQEKYLMGKLVNIKLQQILLATFPGRFEIEKQVQYNCSNFYSNLAQGCIVYVIGKIDAYNREIGPCEFKAIKSTEKIRELKPYDIQQTKYYMAMTNSTDGHLLYYHLDPKYADDPFVEFNITMTEEELYCEHEKLVTDSLSLSEAISAERPDMARHIAFDRDLGWKCKSCLYSKDCKDMRIGASGFKSQGAA